MPLLIPVGHSMISVRLSMRRQRPISDGLATEILTFESNGSFELNPEAASATDFTVTVNGQVQNSGWTFDGAVNGIVFDANSMPPSDAVIEVTYSWSECL